jgi:DNA-binding PadR family transcriptional regulator
MNPLEILSAASKPWTSQHEVTMLSLVVQPALVPTILKKLEERKLAVSRPDDENGRVYQITPAGTRHLEEVKTKRRTSTFPPPCNNNWPPAAA